MDPIKQQLQAEAQRRFGGLGGSSAGVSAPVANNPSPANPMASRGLISNEPTNTGNPTMPSAANPSAGTISAMNSSSLRGGSIIEKALIQRMRQYPPA